MFRLKFVALALLLAGCGKPAPPAAPPPVVAPAPVAVRGGPPVAAQPAKPTRTGNSAVQKSDEALEYTSRDWEVHPEHTNFQVATLTESEERNSYYALAPAAGRNSATLEAFPPETVRVPTNSRRQPLPAGLETLTDEISPEGWPTRIRAAKDGMELSFVPAGVVRVGTNTGAAEARPEHPAFVSAFYMDQHEVTLGQYLTYRDQVRLETKQLLPAPSNAAGQPTEPVLGISWRDAEVYATHHGRQLPTEAEWEAAGRGTQGYAQPWGNERELWERQRLPGQIDPVGSFQSDRSPYGIVDLAGNAREWCADWYRADSFQTALEADGSPRRNWPGPSRSNPVGHRVIKGSTIGWELWARSHATQSQALPDVGFRCVIRLPQLPATQVQPAQEE